MGVKKIKDLLFVMCLIVGFSANAQQPFKRFKPNPPRVDSFDLILSTPPFKPISGRISLAMEMRLYKNYTFKLTPSYMNLPEAYHIATKNMEITNESFDEHFEEQTVIAMIKRYSNKRNSRVYFGPYIGLGIEARRTHFKMASQTPGFKKASFDFSTKRKTLLFALGTTKLISKHIIFDLFVAIKYQYKVKNTGNFLIDGIGYKMGWGGTFGFTIGMPLGKRN